MATTVGVLIPWACPRSNESPPAARAGVPGNVSSMKGHAGMPAAERTIAELLAAGGYACGHVGKWHLGSGPYTAAKRFGFDPRKGIQVLTPIHKGVLGTQALNRLLQERLGVAVDIEFASDGESFYLLQCRAHGHQGLYRARVGIERTARGGIGSRNQDGAGMGEIDPLQGIQAQRGAAAQDDLPGIPMGSQLVLDLLPETGIRPFGQQGHAQTSSPALLQETPYTVLRDQDLFQDHQRAAGPSQDDKVRVEGDRGKPLFQTVHGFGQPLHENGD